MQDGPSTLSLIAAAFYALVSVSCLLASQTAFTHRQQRWHLWAWLAITALFVLLIASRIFDLEEALRASLRSWLATEGLRADRRQYQGVILAVLLAAAVSGVIYGSNRLIRRVRGHRNLAVVISIMLSLAMAVLVALRIVSLHAFDQLLFGVLKLNWFGDLGTSAGILGAAIYYTCRVRGR